MVYGTTSADLFCDGLMTGARRQQQPRGDRVRHREQKARGHAAVVKH
jgi:hypothetical protein